MYNEYRCTSWWEVAMMSSVSRTVLCATIDSVHSSHLLFVGGIKGADETIQYS